MNSVATGHRRLIAGAIDVHCHGYPELARGYGEGLDDATVARDVVESGMTGYVLKSHLWPTADRAYHIAQQVPDVVVVGSITLNAVVGGVNPGVLEAAIVQGAGAAWFPTWTAANDLRRHGFSRNIPARSRGLQQFMEHGLSVLDGAGSLTDGAKGVLRVAHDADIVMGTGHLAPAESLALMAEAQRIGYDKLVFTHPDSNSVGASADEITEAGKRGAYIEWTFAGLRPESQRIKAQEIVEWIGRLGAARCVLTTDAYGLSPLSPPALLQFFAGTVHNLGVGEEDIRMMTVDTPRRLVGLPEKPVETSTGRQQ